MFTEPWWTVDPTTGEPVKVLPADEVEAARILAHDADRKVDIMREATARLMPMLRRTHELHDEGERTQARQELRDAIDWIRQGCPALETTHQDQSGVDVS